MAMAAARKTGCGRAAGSREGGNGDETGSGAAAKQRHSAAIVLAAARQWRRHVVMCRARREFELLVRSIEGDDATVVWEPGSLRPAVQAPQPWRCTWRSPQRPRAHGSTHGPQQTQDAQGEEEETAKGQKGTGNKGEAGEGKEEAGEEEEEEEEEEATSRRSARLNAAEAQERQERQDHRRPQQQKQKQKQKPEGEEEDQGEGKVEDQEEDVPLIETAGVAGSKTGFAMRTTRHSAADAFAEEQQQQQTQAPVVDPSSFAAHAQVAASAATAASSLASRSSQPQARQYDNDRHHQQAPSPQPHSVHRPHDTEAQRQQRQQCEQSPGHGGAGLATTAVSSADNGSDISMTLSELSFLSVSSISTPEPSGEMHPSPPSAHDEATQTEEMAEVRHVGRRQARPTGRSRSRSRGRSSSDTTVRPISPLAPPPLLSSSASMGDLQQTPPEVTAVQARLQTGAEAAGRAVVTRGGTMGEEREQHATKREEEQEGQKEQHTRTFSVPRLLKLRQHIALELDWTRACLATRLEMQQRIRELHAVESPPPAICRSRSRAAAAATEADAGRARTKRKRGMWTGKGRMEGSREVASDIDKEGWRDTDRG